MILVIRISGMVGVTREIEESLNRINLRRKYAATLLKHSKENSQLLKIIRNHVAYGEADSETLIELFNERGKPLKTGSKIDTKKVIQELDKKTLKALGLKPFFRLHPPRKGIESKKHFGIGKGVLGDNKEKINELVRRML